MYDDDKKKMSSNFRNAKYEKTVGLLWIIIANIYNVDYERTHTAKLIRFSQNSVDSSFYYMSALGALKVLVLTFKPID